MIIPFLRAFAAAACTRAARVLASTRARARRAPAAVAANVSNLLGVAGVALVTSGVGSLLGAAVARIFLGGVLVTAAYATTTEARPTRARGARRASRPADDLDQRRKAA